MARRASIDPRKQAQFEIDLLVLRSLTEYVHEAAAPIERHMSKKFNNDIATLLKEAESDEKGENWRVDVLNRVLSAFDELTITLAIQNEDRQKISRMNLEQRVGVIVQNFGDGYWSWSFYQLCAYLDKNANPSQLDAIRVLTSFREVCEYVDSHLVGSRAGRQQKPRPKEARPQEARPENGPRAPRKPVARTERKPGAIKKMCIAWKAGDCKYGNHCIYLHEDVPVSRPRSRSPPAANPAPAPAPALVPNHTPVPVSAPFPINLPGTPVPLPVQPLNFGTGVQLQPTPLQVPVPITLLPPVPTSN